MSVPFDKDLLLSRVCAICGRELHPVDGLGGCQNQMDNAMDLEIRGYWGTTVFDGTDMTGECLLGFICDPCGKKAMERMLVVQKYPDRRCQIDEALLEELRLDDEEFGGTSDASIS